LKGKTEKIEVELPESVARFLKDIEPLSGMTVEEYAAWAVGQQILADLDGLTNESTLFDAQAVKKKYKLD